MPPTSQREGPAYRVHFKNKIANGGCVFTPCQRSIEIRRAKTRERAIEAAKKRFARLERIPDWYIHASIIEVEIIEPEPNALIDKKTSAPDAAKPARSGGRSSA